MDRNVYESWEQFLNPESLRTRIISASIFITSFELLKESIVNRIRDFFTDEFNISGDIVNPEYQTKVLSRNKSPVYASLDWLKEMRAIDDGDIEIFNRIKDCRNKLTHELFSVLGSEGLPADFDATFESMILLLRKVEVWWITEVEIPINPDFDEVDIDIDGIVPGPLIGVQLLRDIALGEDQTSRYYYEEFRKWVRANRTQSKR